MILAMNHAQRQTKTKTVVETVFRSTPAPINLESLVTIVRCELPTTAYSTVYRIVQQFEADGLIHRIDWRERGARYEWAERPHHHHLVCQDCHKVVDLTDADVHYDDSLVASRTGFVITSHSVELSGICDDCQTSTT